MGATFAYRWGDALYLNLTNRCPTACVFCVKTAWGYDFRGHDLALEREPSVQELLAAVVPASEIVFCGFGEPTMRLDALCEVGRTLRARGHTLRLNTVGVGSLVQGRDIAPDLAAAVDRVSVSLNTADAAQWRALHRPAPRLGPWAFESVLAFIAACVGQGIETTVTAVDQPGVDTEAVRLTAGRLGARFRLRPAL